MNVLRNIKAFTLMEIMITVIIIGIIAAFAIPNYGKSVEQSYLQDAITQLSAIRTANQVYYARTGSYWPTSANKTVTQINSSLSLNLIENGLEYFCSPGASVGTTFNCYAYRPTKASPKFTVTVTQAVLLSGTNPSCSGTCP